MKAEEYAQYDAVGLADLIKTQQVSISEVHAAFRDAINRVEPKIESMGDGPYENPLEYNNEGRFEGVPFAIKDAVIQAKGALSRSGSRLLKDAPRGTSDSTLMRRFRDVGFATFGVTKAPEFAMAITTEGSLYGATHNPWDPTRSAGGSSGGAAAAVAAGLFPVAHANDGGGSIRVPAAFNGLVGLKPSRGRVPIGPTAQEVAFGTAVELVVSRTVRDTAAVLDEV